MLITYIFEELCDAVLNNKDCEMTGWVSHDLQHKCLQDRLLSDRELSWRGDVSLIWLLVAARDTTGVFGTLLVREPGRVRVRYGEDSTKRCTGYLDIEICPDFETYDEDGESDLRAGSICAEWRVFDSLADSTSSCLGVARVEGSYQYRLSSGNCDFAIGCNVPYGDISKAFHQAACLLGMRCHPNFQPGDPDMLEDMDAGALFSKSAMILDNVDRPLTWLGVPFKSGISPTSSQDTMDIAHAGERG